MSKTIFFILLLIFSYTHVVKSSEDGFISMEISEKGLDFAKDLLIKRAISSLVPMQLPQIEKSMKIPVVGKVYAVLSNVSIDEVEVSSLIVQTGPEGITMVASGATANLTMCWRYSYSTWLFPIAIEDNGVASVQVDDMEIGLTLSLKDEQGTLKLSLLDCGCYVKYISIKLDGGAAWLYQGVVDAFEGSIASAVEDNISNNLMDGIEKIDSALQTLPREISIGDVAALNTTIMNDPVLSNSSLALSVDGLFTEKDNIVAPSHFIMNIQTPVSCNSPEKMGGISIHENVLNSASLVFFNANLMNWIVDKVPRQSLLNTAEWKHIVPKLYEQFPNDDMSLNITVSSPPIIKIEKQDVVATVYADVTINVLDAGEVIPVVCISTVISASGFAEISSNVLAGSVKLGKFAMSLKWSKVGNLHMFLVQNVISVILKTVVLPVVNLRLKLGFPLPLFHGYELSHSDIVFSDSRLVICSDVAPVGSIHSI